MNDKIKREEIALSMGVAAGRNNVYMQKGFDKKEIKKAIYKLNRGKAAGVDETTAEMLKYRGETLVEWMFMICCLAWRQKYQMNEKRQLLCPCMKVKVVKMSTYNNDRGISLLSPGKVYLRVLTERLMESKEQGESR